MVLHLLQEQLKSITKPSSRAALGPGLHHRPFFKDKHLGGGRKVGGVAGPPKCLLCSSNQFFFFLKPAVGIYIESKVLPAPE